VIPNQQNLVICIFVGGDAERAGLGYGEGWGEGKGGWAVSHRGQRTLTPSTAQLERNLLRCWLCGDRQLEWGF
jgi:hypothetical protein